MDQNGWNDAAEAEREELAMSERRVRIHHALERLEEIDRQLHRDMDEIDRILADE